MKILKYTLLDDLEKIFEPVGPAGYDYIIASNGVCLKASNQFLDCVIRIMRGETIRGLLPIPNICKGLTMKHKLSRDILYSLIDLAQENPEKEQFFQVVLDNNIIGIIKPEQTGSAASVQYKTDAKNVILECHTHPKMDSFFSQTDNQDDTEFRLYMVIGHPEYENPDIQIRLGIYGYFMSAHLKEVFDLLDDDHYGGDYYDQSI